MTFPKIIGRLWKPTVPDEINITTNSSWWEKQTEQTNQIIMFSSCTNRLVHYKWQ